MVLKKWCLFEIFPLFWNLDLIHSSKTARTEIKIMKIPIVIFKTLSSSPLRNEAPAKAPTAPAIAKTRMYFFLIFPVLVNLEKFPKVMPNIENLPVATAECIGTPIARRAGTTKTMAIPTIVPIIAEKKLTASKIIQFMVSIAPISMQKIYKCY